MLRLRHTVTILLATLLMACATAYASPEPERQGQVIANKEVTPPKTEPRQDSPFLKALLSPTSAGAFSTTTAEYCTRAIDPLGLACYVGCPEGCSCSDFGFWYEQCCC